MKRVIKLPNDRRVSLPVYVNAWRTLKAMDPSESVKGWDHFPTPAGEILRKLRAGMHDRINRHLPGYGQGRKWDDIWQLETARAADKLNAPRHVIRWLPHWLRDRFNHRLED